MVTSCDSSDLLEPKLNNDVSGETRNYRRTMLQVAIRQDGVLPELVHIYLTSGVALPTVSIKGISGKGFATRDWPTQLRRFIESRPPQSPQMGLNPGPKA
ncbi:hypothetical protein VN97_g2995 [Penicillium thymicola]|uniref:Uncharacterized protein n=1 Tax=Penicillium thymicola TaxID=293382 RepID=A0AAI9TNA4_PENTH|nr:hypothetical protein VN97_g2995 [Penicillium thymicola]